MITATVNHTLILVAPNRDSDLITNWISQQLKIHFATDNNPNLIQLVPIDETKPTIGINQVRQLLVQLSFHTYTQSPRIVLISPANNLTVEAQNALLKILEEPPKNTYFYLVTDQIGKLLTTVRSRCQVVYLTARSSSTVDRLAPPPHDSLTLSTYTEAINLAEKPKTKNEAIKLLKKMSTQSGLAVKKQQLILETLTQLENNFNVRLTLEHLFFQLIN